MSVKHVKDYYNTMTKDYIDAKETLEKMKNEITDESASEYIKRVDEFKSYFYKIEENYKRISYIIYLLDMPNKKEKKRKYEKMNSKKVTDRTLEKVHEENVACLNKLNIC